MRGAFIAITITLVGCAPSHDAEDAGQRLMILMKKAHGGAALDVPSGYHETGTITFDGTAASYEEWGDFHSLRTASAISRSDGAEMANGFDGERTWKVDPDGSLVTDSSGDAVMSARLSTYLSVHGYFHPDRFPAAFEFLGRRTADGVSYDVVKVTPENAGPVDLWLDTENHRLQRFSGVDGGMAFSGAILKYGVIGGATIPMQTTQKTGRLTLVQTTTSYAYENVPGETFSPPVE